MKKFVLLLAFLFLTKPAFAEVLQASASFDWITKSQIQRDGNISENKAKVFENAIVRYDEKEFKSLHKDYLKDKNYVNNFLEIKDGKIQDEKNVYCGFYIGKNLLVAYGIQPKNDMNHIYYYDALGNLRWVDVFAVPYPNYPYTSYQYTTNGKLFAAYYYVSQYDQYVYDEKQKFKGRWYKDTLYNRKAKAIMTRTSY